MGAHRDIHDLAGAAEAGRLVHEGPSFPHLERTQAVQTFALDALPCTHLRYLASVVEWFYLPTAHVVRKPEFVAPRQGRVYQTDLLEIQGRLIAQRMYREYLGRVDHGRVGAHEVYLVEAYEQHGAGDHRQCGWAFMTRAQYQDYLGRIQGA